MGGEDGTGGRGGSHSVPVEVREGVGFVGWGGSPGTDGEEDITREGEVLFGNGPGIVPEEVGGITGTGIAVVLSGLSRPIVLDCAVLETVCYIVVVEVSFGGLAGLGLGELAEAVRGIVGELGFG